MYLNTKDSWIWIGKIILLDCERSVVLLSKRPQEISLETISEGQTVRGVKGWYLNNPKTESRESSNSQNLIWVMPAKGNRKTEKRESEVKVTWGHCIWPC